MLRISLLGKPKICIGNEEITNMISSKGVGIIAYLISEKRGVKIHREKIATLFWRDSSDKSAKYNLRYTLWSIKKVFKEHGIEDEIILGHDKNYCLINKEADLKCDLEDFQIMSEEILSGNWQRAERFTDIYNGEFLQGLQIRESHEIDDWIIYQRERLQRIYFQTLRKLSDIFLNLNKYSDAIEYLEKLLFFNPLDEDIHRQLMKMYYLSGDRVAAMRQYERCGNLLRSELNISPMEKTNRLYQNIIAGQIHSASETVYSNNYVYPQFFFLTEIIEDILVKYPDILDKIHREHKLELAKLLPELVNEENDPLKYLSIDIEKLRIFRACADVLQKCEQNWELPIVQTHGEIDSVSKEFIEYIKRRLPNIFLELGLD
ncbi:BTAD domain-containing putative transcriptional regulator [Wukongibacter baidiensis]|uniref:AfsR/SARP family transcriptional regulator n=1 Tax=Wukongibacter baidiensis TaxID=1723361 RepID=UPI003D7F4A97